MCWWPEFLAPNAERRETQSKVKGTCVTVLPSPAYSLLRPRARSLASKTPPPPPSTSSLHPRSHPRAPDALCPPPGARGPASDVHLLGPRGGGGGGRADVEAGDHHDVGLAQVHALLQGGGGVLQGHQVLSRLGLQPRVHLDCRGRGERRAGQARVPAGPRRRPSPSQPPGTPLPPGPGVKWLDRGAGQGWQSGVPGRGWKTHTAPASGRAPASAGPGSQPAPRATAPASPAPPAAAAACARPAAAWH